MEDERIKKLKKELEDSLKKVKTNNDLVTLKAKYLGKTGIVTPVAVLEPVQLAGSTVSRASLHNFDEIKRLDIRIGDSVLIMKAAEIIPKVVKVVESEEHSLLPEYILPTKCPACNSDLVEKDGQVGLYCPNPNCESLMCAKIEYWASKEAMDIDKVGPALIAKLYDKKMISNYL